MSERVLGIASYVLVGVAATIAGGYIAWRCGVDGSTIAAWVQAVGSIAAIIGAFVILNHQQTADARLRQWDEKRRYAARFMQVFLLAGDTAEAFGHLAVLLAPEEFDEPDGEPWSRKKAIARVAHVARRIDGIAAAVAGIIRTGELELEHVSLLWSLNQNLHKLGQMLAGISDPFDELDATAMVKFDAMVSEVKDIRYRAASISAQLERAVAVGD